jgi:hypothetical protein
LETDSLTVELTPLKSVASCQYSVLSKTETGNRALFHFFVRGVLAATAAEFLEFQPLGRRLAVLRCRIVPLFAVTAL